MTATILANGSGRHFHAHVSDMVKDITLKSAKMANGCTYMHACMYLATCFFLKPTEQVSKEGSELDQVSCLLLLLFGVVVQTNLKYIPLYDHWKCWLLSTAH